MYVPIIARLGAKLLSKDMIPPTHSLGGASDIRKGKGIKIYTHDEPLDSRPEKTPQKKGAREFCS